MLRQVCTLGFVPFSRSQRMVALIKVDVAVALAHTCSLANSFSWISLMNKSVRSLQLPMCTTETLLDQIFLDHFHEGSTEESQTRFENLPTKVGSRQFRFSLGYSTLRATIYQLGQDAHSNFAGY
jgi:hypothetical protein